MIKGVIFDVDGVLLNSMPIWENLGELYLRSLGVEAEKDLGELFRCQRFPQTLAADGIILAEAAAKSAAGEKYGSASAGAADDWLLPVVEGCPGGFKFCSAAAAPGSSPAVCAAHAGAEDAVVIDFLIH